MAGSDVLTKKISYEGDPISVKSLEGTLSEERDRQNIDIGKLKTLRARNKELSKNLVDEVKRLRKFSDFLAAGKTKGSFWARFKELLSYIPGLGKLMITRRSIEELLKQQYEISSNRVKEAADYADRLKATEKDLFREIERLNAKIVEHAQNEEAAADYVLELKAWLDEKTSELEKMDEDSVEYRKLQGEIDSARELLSEHSTLLELYSSAEDRLSRLKENTRKLQETITHLYSDIRKYVTAASEKLDESLAHIQAIGTAADASVVLLDMKTSLDSMTASMNETTRFVSETQIYLRENLDNLIQDLELYDEETAKMLDRNLEMSRAIEDEHVSRAIEKAKAFKERQSQPPA